ncbi:hypothetical protein B0H66DRAFT_608527 [Apodospora peruviana]|uniref:Uncharacterized protein n=1 Tax=Apodospora peruviana TaxID=516989 RepID=A0AAE0LZ50_9PEZI|nr:hypothetical protein B0H66DRAFT_608527 [Apodospora peruviana]
MATFSKALAGPEGLKIIRRILSFVDSPRDIFSAIRTCKAIYMVYNTASWPILVQVIINGFGMNLKDALALLNVPVFERGDHLPELPSNILIEQSIWSRKVRTFATTYYNALPVRRAPNANALIWGNWATQRETIIKLARLHTIVDAFTDQYMKNFRSLMTKCTPKLTDFSSSGTSSFGKTNTIAPRISTELPQAVSFSEKHRLQRAFIRFELVCRLFSIPFWKMLLANQNDGEEGVEKILAYQKNDYHVDKFLYLFDTCDAEQILSVGVFVRTQYRVMLQDMRLKFVGAGDSDSESESGDKIDIEQPSADDTPQPEKHDLYWHLQNYKSFMVNHLDHLAPPLKTPHPNRIDFENQACGLGLVLLRKLLKLNVDARNRELRELLGVLGPFNESYEDQHEISTSFKHTDSFVRLDHDDPIHPERPSSTPPYDEMDINFEGERNSYDTVSESSSASEGSEGSGVQHMVLDYDADTYPLRLLGFPFWDSNRLEAQEFADFRLLCNNASLEAKPYGPKDKIPPGFGDWETSKSYKRTLQRTKVTQAEFNELRLKFFVERFKDAEDGMDKRRAEGLKEVESGEDKPDEVGEEEENVVMQEAKNEALATGVFNILGTFCRSDDGETSFRLEGGLLSSQVTIALVSSEQVDYDLDEPLNWFSSHRAGGSTCYSRSSYRDSDILRPKNRFRAGPPKRFAPTERYPTVASAKCRVNTMQNQQPIELERGRGSDNQ